MANFRRNTRYTGARVTRNRSGQDFLILRRPLQLERADGDVFITITSDDIRRPDLIAQKAYGNPDLWWVILEFNGIRDPLFDLQVGSQLRIPEVERVLAAIDELRRG